MENQKILNDSTMSITSGENKRTNVWSRRTLCFITGASRGLGQRMAIRFAERFPLHSVLILTARNYRDLEATKESIERLRSDIKVSIWAIDLADICEAIVIDYLQRIVVELFLVPDDFEQFMLVHNAGSMGNISEWFTGQSDANELNRYWSLNLTSVAILNATFWKYFVCKNANQQRIVINISSICAKQAIKSWSIYCAGKAARDMMFATMALEEPDILVLSYAPGPLDTDMQLVARTQTKDPEIKDMFAGLHSDSRLLTCNQSLDRLMSLLQVNSFNSGSHIDYYDDDD